MPIINVQMLTGRTDEQKQAYVRELAELTGRTLAIPEDAIRIVLSEVAPENWGVGGKTMASLRSAQSS